MRTLHGFVAVLVLGVGIGCSGPSGSADSGDSPLVDAQREAVADATGLTESLLPDAIDPDFSPPDAIDPDFSLPDAIDPDFSLPDGNVPDSTLPDGGVPDVPADEAPTPDEIGEDTAPEKPFATVSGECGEIDSVELESPSPFLFVNHIDFADDPYDDADFGLLSPGGQEVILDGNAGGSSILSEVFSYEVLLQCEGATLLKTEMEIVYTDPQSKKTDLLVSIDGLKVAVSVTRAVSWPFDSPYTSVKAEELLKKKLKGIAASNANVAPEDAWTKQILHVLAWSDSHAEVLEEVWDGLDPVLRGDTLLLVTITDGDDAFLY